VTGALLLASEWLRHRQVHRELSGVVTFVKLVILGAAFHGLLPAKGAVLLVLSHCLARLARPEGVSASIVVLVRIPRITTSLPTL